MSQPISDAIRERLTFIQNRVHVAGDLAWESLERGFVVDAKEEVYDIIGYLNKLQQDWPDLPPHWLDLAQQADQSLHNINGPRRGAAASYILSELEYSIKGFLKPET